MLAQRIMRAKEKVRNTSIRYEVPLAQELLQRRDAVLQVIYLVFNDGFQLRLERRQGEPN